MKEKDLVKVLIAAANASHFRQTEEIVAFLRDFFGMKEEPEPQT